MPPYVVLLNWTEQGIRNVRETIERTDNGAELAEKHGLKLEQVYWTVGPYDRHKRKEEKENPAFAGFRELPEKDSNLH
jgi:uncharacterized protein with GYD domain